MENVKNKYETIFVIDASLSEDQINATTEKFKALIEANATVESVDVWGKRRLAYPIDYKTEGYYVLVNFQADANAPKAISKQLNITENVVRQMIVAK